MCEFALWKHPEIHALDNPEFRVFTLACLQHDRGVFGKPRTGPPFQIMREAFPGAPGVSGPPGTPGYWSARKWRGRGKIAPARRLALKKLITIKRDRGGADPVFGFKLHRRIVELIREGCEDSTPTRKPGAGCANQSSDWHLWQAQQVYALDDAAFRVLRYATLERDRVGEPFPLRRRDVCTGWNDAMWAGARGAWGRLVQAGFLDVESRVHRNTIAFRLSTAWRTGRPGRAHGPAAISIPRAAPSRAPEPPAACARPSPPAPAPAPEIERGGPARIGEILPMMNLATP